jgi:chromate transporter
LSRRRERPLAEVALVFSKLGLIGFGGPAAHVALMRRELVIRRRWVTEERFLELFGASNLIPGPSSTELGMMLGYERAGWPGLLVAGVCFIVPAFAAVLGIAWAYVRSGTLPQTEWVLRGIKPVVIALVADALWQLGRRLRSGGLVGLAVAVLVLYLLGVDAVLLLFGGALLTMVASGAAGRHGRVVVPLVPLGVIAASVPSLSAIFLEFLKIGVLVIGSGYVLYAFLRGDLVEGLGWLSEAQLLDAVAVGQVTPGPVFTTATFIGYVLRGAPGAAIATVAIFLPAFVLAAVVFGQLHRIRRSRAAMSFVDGATAAALGLMGGVSVQLGRAVLTGWFPVVLALAAFVVARRSELNPAWLIGGGAILGLAGGALGL